MAEIQQILNPTHITTPGAHSAGVITNTPSGDITSSTVQGAINELGTQKANNTIQFFPTLSSTLRAGKTSSVINIFSDSTGYYGWPDQMYVALKTKFPAVSQTYAIRDQTTGELPLHTMDEFVASGGKRRWQVATTGVWLPASSSYSPPAGDIDISVYVHGALSSVTSDACFVSYLNPSAVGIEFGLIASAKLMYARFSVDGSTMFTVYASSGIGVLSNITLRVTRVASTGAYSFYYSINGGKTWVSNGSGTSTSGAPVYPASGMVWRAGSAVIAGGTKVATGLGLGRIYVRAGLNGRHCIPLTTESWAPLVARGAVLAGSPELHIVNNSKPGVSMAYWNTNYATAFVQGDPCFVIYADGHNWLDNNRTANGIATWATLLANLRGIDPAVCLGVVTQNPSDSTGSTDQGAQSYSRAARQLAWARGNGFGYVDVTSAWDLSIYPLNDGLHPTAAGYQFWGNLVAEKI